jgi:hypothetical protein
VTEIRPGACVDAEFNDDGVMVGKTVVGACRCECGECNCVGAPLCEVGCEEECEDKCEDDESSRDCSGQLFR